MNVTAKQVSPQELAKLASDYHSAMGMLGGKVENWRELASNPMAQARLRSWWSGFAQTGILLSQAVLGSKEVPSGQRKNLENAVRLFMSTSRGPNNVVAWFDKNQNLLNLLYDATYKWPDKTEGEQKFIVGPFTVHNTIGLEGDDLEGIKNALAKAAVLIKGSSVPGIDKVLYGDVMIVGKLAKGTTVAWYYPNEDVVYVRPFKNAGADELSSIIHELGHRYQMKFMDKAVHSKWVRYHTLLEYQRSNVTVELPKVGEALPFLLQGIKGYPVIQKIETLPSSQHAIYYFSDTRGLPELSLKTLMTKVLSQNAKYPTAYSAKSEAEHFCDALALRAMGKLKEPHLNAFKSIIEDGTEYAMKLAAGTYVQISRDDLEDWLGHLHLHSKWKLKQGKAGVYLLPLSDTVAVKLSSTIGTSDDAMGRGMASMQLALVSLITGQTLNKKAQGQGHFKRTTNWKKTWAEGFDRMKEAYMKSQGFYDALAAIEDRDKYRDDIIKHIESAPNWRNDNLLSDFHARVRQGGILSSKQVALMERLVDQARPKQAPIPAPPEQARQSNVWSLVQKHHEPDRGGNTATYETYYFEVKGPDKVMYEEYQTHMDGGDVVDDNTFTFAQAANQWNKLLRYHMPAQSNHGIPPFLKAAPQAEDPMLEVLRNMYRAAQQDQNQWLMDFTKSVADQLKRGRPLSEKQQAVIDKNRVNYRLAARVTLRFLASR